MKKIIIIVSAVVVLIAAVALVLIFNKKPEETKKQVAPEIKDGKYEELTITDIKITPKEKETILDAKVTNPTESPKNIREFYIELVDKDGKAIGSFLCFLGDEAIKPHETRGVNAVSMFSIEDKEVRSVKYQKSQS